MKIISKSRELKRYLQSQEGVVGFVPTMGALHEGHLSLIKRAERESELVVVSIFVNPTQFLQGEDFDKYPSRAAADIKICELAGVDVLFMPDASEIYTEDEITLLAPAVRGYILEGATRPGHFNGVLTIVNKLFNIVNPDFAYFGKKDAQQLHLIELMVKQLFMSVTIVPVDTLRDSDGLALSSRNVYLNEMERKEALKLSVSLSKASKMLAKGIDDTAEILSMMHQELEPLQIGYIAIVNRDFQSIDTIEVGNSIILVEALVGDTRLLDNIWL